MVPRVSFLVYSIRERDVYKPNAKTWLSPFPACSTMDSALHSGKSSACVTNNITDIFHWKTRRPHGTNSNGQMIKSTYFQLLLDDFTNGILLLRSIPLLNGLLQSKRYTHTHTHTHIYVSIYMLRPDLQLSLFRSWPARFEAGWPASKRAGLIYKCC